MTAINLASLTDATDTTEGTGVFDVLIQAVQRQIDSQYTEGRLAGRDFATVYLGSMQAVLSSSIEFLLREQEAEQKAELIAQQVLSETKNNEIDGVIDRNKDKLLAEKDFLTAKTIEETADTVRRDAESAKKVLLLAAQTLGFNSDTKQKILKLMLDGYAVNLSIAGTADVPETVLDSSIDQLSQEILTDVGSSVDIQSSAQTIPVGD